MKGIWEEEVRCPRVPPLTLTGLTRGQKGKKEEGSDGIRRRKKAGDRYRN